MPLHDPAVLCCAVLRCCHVLAETVAAAAAVAASAHGCGTVWRYVPCCVPTRSMGTCVCVHMRLFRHVRIRASVQHIELIKRTHLQHKKCYVCQNRALELELACPNTCVVQTRCNV